jgi:hypothetical protein
LLTAHAGLEGVIRHKTNRTLIGKFGYEFLPSLNASPPFRIPAGAHPGDAMRLGKKYHFTRWD